MSPPRKPPGTSFEAFTDLQVAKAEKDGLFDDLPGKGKPLKNLDGVYDPMWWAKQMVQREGVSVLPASLEIRRTVEREVPKILSLSSETMVRARVEALNVKIRHVNRTSVSGPPTSVAPLNVDDVIARWKSNRSGRREEESK